MSCHTVTDYLMILPVHININSNISIIIAYTMSLYELFTPFIQLMNFLTKLIGKSTELWKDIPPESLIVRSCDKAIEINKAVLAFSSGSAHMVSEMESAAFMV